MIKVIFVLMTSLLFLLSIDPCRARNDTDSMENSTETSSPKPSQPFVYYGRYHPRRARRQMNFDLNQLLGLVSSLPLDRIGPIVGQVMNSGLKEVLHPNLVKQLNMLLGDQGPAFFASLLGSVSGSLRAPVRSSIANITMAMNKLPSSSPLMQSLRRPRRR